jgi:hypothetical protein
MPLHIFLGDEELLYFIVRVEVIEIQIWFEFKLVCNLQKGLKIYNGFSIFLRRIGPIPGLGPTGLLSRASQMAQCATERPGQPSGRAPISCSPIRPDKSWTRPKPIIIPAKLFV